MSDYPDPFVPKERSLEEWAKWFADFKLRHGLTPERIAQLTGQKVPTPPADAKIPPQHHADTEREEETQP